MTDRELLEWVAKAAGLRLKGYATFAGDEFKALLIKVQGGPVAQWNPLTDDGDALRLAVKLGISMGIYQDPDETWCSVGIHESAKEPHGTDPCAATRRAIVRVAAEIGKAKP